MARFIKKYTFFAVSKTKQLYLHYKIMGLFLSHF